MRVTPDIEQFECSVFDGNYITGDVTPAYLARLEQSRNDENQSKKNPELLADNGIMDLHNDE